MTDFELIGREAGEPMMNQILCRTAPLCVAAVLWASTAIESSHAAGPESKLADFYGFKPLEVFKLERRSANLLQQDFNNDGLVDLLLIDNSHSRLDLLQQRAEEPDEPAGRDKSDVNIVGSDWRFEHRKLPLNRQVASLTSGDWNGDGRIDVAYFGVPDRLIVRLQPETGDWSKQTSWRIPDLIPQAWSIAGGDINSDGRDDLVAIGKTATYLFYQNDDGRLNAPRKLMNTSSKLGLLQIADFDGDGRRDICYLSNDESERGLCARFQDEHGELGPELRFDLKQPRAVTMTELDGERGHEILSIDPRTGRIKVSKLRRPEQRDDDVAARLVQYGFGEPGSGKDRDLGIGDLDGDGLQDVVVTDPAAAQMLVFRQHRGEGIDLGSSFPGLLGAEQLRVVDLDGDKRAEVVVLSSKEKTLAISRFENERLTFPRTVAIPAGLEPVCVETPDFDRDGKPEIVYIARDRKSGSSKYELHRLVADGDAWTERGFGDESALTLELKGTPNRLLSLDANHDGRNDFIVFLDLNRAPVLLVTSEAGQPTVVDTQGGISLGKIPGGAMFVGSGQKPTILAAQENFARSLKLEGEYWQVVDQYNAAESAARIAAAAEINVDGEPGSEIVLVDTGVKKLRILRNESNVYRPWREIELGSIVFRSLSVADLNGDNRDDLILFGGGQFAVLYTGRSDPILEEVASYETKLEKTFFTDLVAGDLNGDGSRDIAVLDSRSHYVVVLNHHPEHGLRHAMHFKVFEEKSFRRERNSTAGAEPREAVIADVTSDGRDDLILLTHDRVLVYPQDDGIPETARAAADGETPTAQGESPSGSE